MYIVNNFCKLASLRSELYKNDGKALTCQRGRTKKFFDAATRSTAKDGRHSLTSSTRKESKSWLVDWVLSSWTKVGNIRK